jgi:hypothetical protein
MKMTATTARQKQARCPSHRILKQGVDAIVLPSLDDKT